MVTTFLRIKIEVSKVLILRVCVFFFVSLTLYLYWRSETRRVRKWVNGTHGLLLYIST